MPQKHKKERHRELVNSWDDKCGCKRKRISKIV
jgi:hypothetical protein